MKKTIALLTIATAVCLSMTGCLAPNTTAKFNMNPMTGSVSWSNPKDTTVQDIEAGISTNGTRYIKVTGLSTLNNPAVVSAVGVAQANSITATGTAATQIMNAVTAAAGTAGGAAAASAIK